MYSVSNFCIVMQLKVQIHVKVCCKDIQKIDFPSKKKKKTGNNSQVLILHFDKPIFQLLI